MIRTGKHLQRALLAAFATVLAFAAIASAAEQTRETYVAAVEPICQKNKAAADRLLGPVKNWVKQDKLTQAGTAFAKAATELEKTQKALVAVEQPPADAARLTKWLSEIKAEAALMKTISTKFKQGKKGPATTLVNKLTNNATKANNGVVVFQFHYCKIDPSKYT